VFIVIIIYINVLKKSIALNIIFVIFFEYNYPYIIITYIIKVLKKVMF